MQTALATHALEQGEKRIAELGKRGAGIDDFKNRGFRRGGQNPVLRFKRLAEGGQRLDLVAPATPEWPRRGVRS
jgi:hypothetical protein